VSTKRWFELDKFKGDLEITSKILKNGKNYRCHILNRNKTGNYYILIVNANGSYDPHSFELEDYRLVSTIEAKEFCNGTDPNDIVREREEYWNKLEKAGEIIHNEEEFRTKFGIPKKYNN
jgi:hypothetical protein